MLEKCPKCGGHLTDEPGNEYLVCDDCGEMYIPEAEERKLAEEDAPKIVDQTVELGKIAVVKKIVYPIMFALIILCIGLVFYEINEYTKATDVKFAVGAFSSFDEYDNLETTPSTKLTEKIMRDDYNVHFAIRYRAIINIVIILGSAIGIAVSVLVSLIIIEIADACIFKRPKNKRNIALLGGPAAIAVIVYLVILAIMIVIVPTSPDKAKYDLVIKEYRGKKMDRTYNNLENKTYIHYYATFEEDGEEKRFSISEFEYDHVFPTHQGEYYCAYVDGELFHLYPTSTYIN